MVVTQCRIYVDLKSTWTLLVYKLTAVYKAVLSTFVPLQKHIPYFHKTYTMDFFFNIIIQNFKHILRLSLSNGSLTCHVELHDVFDY